jgi:hypothetical protein
VSCKTRSNNAEYLNIKINRLDSIKNTYIYYSNNENDPEVFRILTPKIENLCKEKIIINNTYKIRLIDLSSPIYNPNIGGFWYNNTRISIKESGVSSKIYTTEDIKGLCYIIK